MKFRKKPVVIEAMHFTDENKDAVFGFVGCNCYPEFDQNGKPCLVIQTREGDMITELGDWVIKGVKGEFYPVKDDIFELTYDKVE